MVGGLRVFAFDGMHFEAERTDLRVLLLEGCTSNNTIMPIAFCVCFQETTEISCVSFHG